MYMSLIGFKKKSTLGLLDEAGFIAALRIQLHELLIMEQHFTLMKEVLEQKSIEKATVELEKDILCLQNQENRGCEALFFHVL